MLTSFTCQYFFFEIILFIYFWLDLHCCVGFSLAVVSISSLAAVCGLLIVVASLVREPWL